MLAGVDVVLAPYPSIPPDSETVLDHLLDSGCTAVDVYKRREGRLWQSPSRNIIVEIAHFTRPELIVSVGLESWDSDSDGEAFSDHRAKGDLRAVIEHFGLHDESLRAMNYMDAVSIWASAGRLQSGAPL